MNRRDFLKSMGSAGLYRLIGPAGAGPACAGVLSAAGFIGCRKAAGGSPNILMILSDDQGWGDLSLHGNRNLNTPNIDSLARQGAQFERFFVCPVCAPTRAEMLTGRYHPRGGVHGVSTGAERLNSEEKTIGDAFKAGGYATAAYGKWHNGTQYPYHPNARGFDDYYGFCSGHWGHYFDPVLEHNGKIVRGNGYIIDDLTDHGLQFIEKNRDRPFFCYLPFNTPHSPMHVPDSFYEKFDQAALSMRHKNPEKEKIQHTRAALAMVENIDWNVGRLLKLLDKLNLSSNTIVIYFSDNGPNGWRWNGRMKGRKGSTDEGGVRVPCFIRWPGHIQAGLRINQISSAIDLLPTLSEMSGIKTISNKPLDGISLRPLLTGHQDDWPDRMIFTHHRGRVSVRTQRYRLDQAGQLFDMKTDPEQTKDISTDKPDVKKRLDKAVKDWKEEVLSGIEKNRPFPVGYPEYPMTPLPARDGIPGGGVKRSNRAPNCSYFTYWTRKKDRITWDIEVQTKGQYNAVVYYTCPEKDKGSLIDLSFGKNHVRARITEAHDPPLRGMESDRFDRGSESFVKDFRPLKLGDLEMEKGRGLLTLRALEIPGAQVMDVRALVLTLIKS